MVVKKVVDVAMSTTKFSYALLTTTLVFHFMSTVNNVCLFVINCLSLRCCELWKTRWYNFVPFQKLSKGRTEIVQACDSCCMPGFCANIVLTFILGVESFDYAVDRGEGRVWICKSLAGGGGKPNGGYDLKMRGRGIKPSGCHGNCWSFVCCLSWIPCSLLKYNQLTVDSQHDVTIPRCQATASWNVVHRHRFI